MAIFPFVGRGRLSEGCQHVSPWGWTLGEYPQESDYMAANDSGQTRFFFRIRLGKLDNFWMILPEGPVRTSGQRINEAYSRDHDQFQRFGAWDLETCPKKSSRNTVVSCPAGFQGHAWKSNTRYFLYEVCFLVVVSGREGLGVTSVQVGDVWRLLKDWQWEGLPTATAKSFRGIWLQSMDCQWLSQMVFQTHAQVIVMRDNPFHHGNS